MITEVIVLFLDQNDEEGMFPHNLWKDILFVNDVCVVHNNICCKSFAAVFAMSVLAFDWTNINVVQ